ncbi:mediator of RNA polymerase ii transcription subunit 8 [Anaeramoeba flamelloides]|uniref:Mediator of RNA polymerase ii transcription subunit n=1 Tax=Anaeramoeba flamelloides TaxID=1746091 RepID=A0AAV7ZNE1_9EUKA|nr:mediator of RNA polymerase ii transcription subunit [Anaeramoeba flamelloides]KAJ6233343.1 mediator of RNA polymerase ii transcription subunit 8 [Anaeramoeba flamelloides]
MTESVRTTLEKLRKNVTKIISSQEKIFEEKDVQWKEFVSKVTILSIQFQNLIGELDTITQSAIFVPKKLPPENDKRIESIPDFLNTGLLTEMEKKDKDSLLEYEKEYMDQPNEEEKFDRYDQEEEPYDEFNKLCDTTISMFRNTKRVVGLDRKNHPTNSRK